MRNNFRRLQHRKLIIILMNFGILYHFDECGLSPASTVIPSFYCRHRAKEEFLKKRNCFFFFCSVCHFANFVFFFVPFIGLSAFVKEIVLHRSVNDHWMWWHNRVNVGRAHQMIPIFSSNSCDHAWFLACKKRNVCNLPLLFFEE